MKVRYFAVDGRRQLHKTSQATVHALWGGEFCPQLLRHAVGNELRIVTVACNEHLFPIKIYLLRLPLCEGMFTAESHLTLQVFTMPDCVTPTEAFQYHSQGWPRDLLSQLAVALDVPRRDVQVPIDVGGPLLVAAALRVSPSEAQRYLSWEAEDGLLSA